MTIANHKALFAATAVVLLAMGSAARADDMSGQTTAGAWSAYASQQAGAAQDSDPTVRDSVRSHGRP